MKFLQQVLAAFTALVIFCALGFFFFIVLLFAMEDSDTYRVRDNTVLKIRLDRLLAERDSEDPFSSLTLAGSGIKKMGLVEVRQALKQAAGDDRVKGVLLYAPELIGGLARGQELRQALAEFKKSGKFIWAWGEVMSEGAYYVASVADSIFLPAEGMLEWNGLAMELTFFKRTFDKLDIEPQIFRVGEFKSAVEPFMLEQMSPENRLQLNSILNSVYDTMIRDMAANLGLESGYLRQLSDSMQVHSAADAVKLGLISGLAYEDEVEERLAALMGLEDADDIHWATYKQYNSAAAEEEESDNRIAVIVAEGEIRMRGKSSEYITPGKFIRELRRAREDEKVKAVVFRINSPGGDALASDLIWHEVEKTARVKPVIASLADVAASGGYYIAMAADTIVAQPTTITGSIGIFGIVFNIGDFMANKLGITTDRVSTGLYSNLFTSTRPLTDAEKAIIQEQVESGYRTFTTKAAAGRNMPVQELLKLASGRVWTGGQALENGLIDELGGLDRAIEIAAARAGVAGDYAVRYYPSPLSAFEELLAELTGQVRTARMKEELGNFYPYWQILERVRNMQRVQARLPYEITIK